MATATNRLSHLIRDDIDSARASPAAPGNAIGGLCAIGGFKHRDRVRPHQLARSVMERQPALLEKLNANQRESLHAMVLAHVIATATEWRGASRVIDGGRLVHEWESLSETARALYPSETDAAVRKLAEQAGEGDISVARPSELAHALLADGRTRAALTNGGLNHD